MKSSQNLYDYKPEKSKNEETLYLSIGGRISGLTLFYRVLFAIVLGCTTVYIYVNYALPKKEFYVGTDGELPDGTFKTTFEIFEYFTFGVIPLFILVFLNIQFIKRIHDINKSGWFLLVPFYNVFLIFSKGTVGENNYGLDPKPVINNKYFDGSEIEANKKLIK